MDGSLEVSTRSTAEAAEVYLRKVNDAGGVNSHTFNVVTVNASTNLETALRRTAETIRQHRPAALLNYYGSTRTSTLIKSSILEATRTPIIGANVSSILVRQDPDNHWVFYVRAGVQAEAKRWSTRRYRWVANVWLSSTRTMHLEKMACARASTP
ncbi:hypothetical protein ACEQUB_p01158 (plasmid) [Ralstonia syzygii]